MVEIAQSRFCPSVQKPSPYAFSLPFSHEQLPFSIVDSFPHVSLLLRKKKKKKNIYNQSFSLTIPRPKQFNFNSPLSLSLSLSMRPNSTEKAKENGRRGTGLHDFVL